MTTRRWTLLMTLALGASVIGLTPVAAAPVQEPVPTTAPAEAPAEPIAPVVEPAPEAPVAPVAEAADEPESRPLFTESRKIVAIIGGLVFVALALALLTVRYWRMTKPVAIAVPPVDDEQSAEKPVLESPVLQEPVVAAPSTAEVPASVAAADHRPDASWEPRGTGEHAAISLEAELAPARPASPIARPPRQARQAALARSVEVGEAR